MAHGSKLAIVDQVLLSTSLSYIYVLQPFSSSCKNTYHNIGLTPVIQDKFLFYAQLIDNLSSINPNYYGY